MLVIQLVQICTGLMKYSKQRNHNCLFFSTTQILDITMLYSQVLQTLWLNDSCSVFRTIPEDHITEKCEECTEKDTL